MFKRPCNYPGCPELITGKDHHCPVHQKQRRAESDKRRTNQADRKFYSTQTWKSIRKSKLIANPFCEQQLSDGTICNAIATDVDHITARSADGADTLDNLRSLCHPCHSRKTIAIDGGFGRKKAQQ